MYQSLYAILTPLVAEKQSGYLSLSHENGKTANLTLQEGNIIDVQTDTSRGGKACKELALWVYFSHEFSLENTASQTPVVDTGIENYLSLLAKIDERYNKIVNAVSFDEYVFKFAAGNVDGNIDFDKNELKVALALDGQTPLKQVIRKTAVPDLLVLNCIYKMIKLGIVQKETNVAAGDVLNQKEAEELTAVMTETLAEYVGPAAELIYDEVFGNLDSSPELIQKNELPQLISAISDHLEGEDSLLFKKRALEYIRKL
jgi:hypothetical protein